MFAPTDLLELHRRTHLGLEGLLEHCAGFSQDELTRRLEGFGDATVLLQLHHVLGAEQYWIGVLEGKMLVDELETDHASIEALRAFRDRVTAATRAYLRATSERELGTAREVTTWGDRRVTVVPAHVLLRTQTHVFHHKGQVASMCRLLGRPVPQGLDYPVGE